MFFIRFSTQLQYLELGASVLEEVSRHSAESGKNCYSALVVFSSAAEYIKSRTSKEKPPCVATAVQAEGIHQEIDREVLSPWTVPDDIQRILQDTHDSLFQVGCLLTLRCDLITTV